MINEPGEASGVLPEEGHSGLKRCIQRLSNILCYTTLHNITLPLLHCITPCYTASLYYCYTALHYTTLHNITTTVTQHYTTSLYHCYTTLHNITLPLLHHMLHNILSLKRTCEENVQTIQSHSESIWTSNITPYRDWAEQRVWVLLARAEMLPSLINSQEGYLCV